VRVCVTGAAGFVASHLAERLLAAGHDVTGIDDMSSGRRENVPAGVRLVEGDIRHAGAVQAAMRGCDAVAHLAAIPSVPASLADPRSNVAVAVVGTLEVLEAARAAGASRVVFASSCAIYGDSDRPLHERAPLRPLSPYAAGKASAESLVTVWGSLGWLSTCSLRLFNVYGPRQSGAYGAVVPLFAEAARAGLPVRIDGDGQQRRSFVHVDDVARAFVLALESDATGPINVAGEQVSLLNLLTSLELETGVVIDREHGPARDGDVRTSAGLALRARLELDWRPEVSLDEGLRRLLA